MSSDDEIRGLMVMALKELDRSFGIYKSGAVISGRAVPSYKDVVNREDPLRLTQRVLVKPVMECLGYSDVCSYDLFDGRVPGLSMATVTMNSVFTSAVSRVLCAMNADNAPKGIATDGFRWALAVSDDGCKRVCALSDLRPYYVEILERDRFRAAIPVIDEALGEFIEIFSNP